MPLNTSCSAAVLPLPWRSSTKAVGCDRRYRVGRWTITVRRCPATSSCWVFEPGAAGWPHPADRPAARAGPAAVDEGDDVETRGPAPAPQAATSIPNAEHVAI